MAGKKKDPAEKASVNVMVRLTPHQADVLDAVIAEDAKITEMEARTRPEYVRDLIRDDYRHKVKYGGMPPIDREGGGS